MIEVRTYEGDAAEITRLTRDVWDVTYQGKMLLPLWNESYFDWQLLAPRPGGRDYLVVAYDGSELIGSFLAERFRFRLDGRDFDASMASWLTVRPEYVGWGVGRMLVREQLRRQKEHGAAFLMGFTYFGSRASRGPHFWKTFPEQMMLGKVGFWARPLDHRAVARWEMSRIERIGSQALRLVQSGRPAPRDRTAIRRFRPDDLPACLELAHGLLDRVDLGYVWTPERLAHQLQYRDVPRTLVLERNGRPAGFLNYYRLDFLGRCAIEAAMIDLAAFGNLPHRDRVRLLRAALADMADEGIKLALLLRLPCYPARPLLSTGFIPMPNQFQLTCFRIDADFLSQGVRRLHVHWR